MALSLSDIQNQINQQSGNISYVTVQGDGSLKGDPNPPLTTGLYISKLGFVYGNFDGSTITLQGGNMDWYGSLIQDELSLGFTPAQFIILNQISNLLRSANSNVYIDTTGIA